MPIEFTQDIMRYLYAAHMLYLVFNLYQGKAFGRGGRAGFPAVFRGEDLSHAAFGKVSPSDLDEGAYDVTNHVVQETVGFDIDMDEIFFFFKSYFLYRPSRIFYGR